MKKRIFSCLVILAVILCVLPVYAEDEKEQGGGDKTVSWTEIFNSDFEDGTLDSEFYSYFNTYDLNENNFKTEDGNTYYNGMFPNGAYINSLQSMAEYRLKFDIRTAMPGNAEGENAYKSAVALQHPYSDVSLCVEPDNNDEDKTSYLGTGGIYLFMFDNILEVTVHCNKDGGTAGPVNGAGKTGTVEKASDRMFGVYGVSYQFTLPEGKSFNEFVSVDISLKDGVITVMLDGSLFCTVELSQTEKITTLISEDYWDKNKAGIEILDNEESYRKAVIKDSAGQEVLTVDSAVVPVEGAFAFVNRANNYNLDNFTYYELEVTSTPTPKPSETPDASQNTKEPTKEPTASATADKSDSEKEGGSSITVILIAAIAVVVIAIIIVFVLGKKKNK